MKKSILIASGLFIAAVFLTAAALPVTASTVEQNIVLSTGDIIIPKDNFDGGSADVPVPANSVAGVIYKAVPDVEFWYKAGSSKTWFNLNELYDHTHKDKTTGGVWKLYLNDVEQTTDTVNDYSKVLVKSGDVIKLVYSTDNFTVILNVADAAKPTATASPLPFAAILAGLGAAAVLFAVRKE